MNENLEKIYKDIKYSGSLSSVDKLYNDIKKSGISVKKSDVEKYLKGKPSYTLHKVTRKKFKRRRYLVAYPGHTICSDVAYLQEYKKSNDGVGYIIVFIDLFSKYLTVFPLKSLKAVTLSPILDYFFKNSIHKYRKIFTDDGQEYLSKEVKNIYDLHGIFRYTTYSKEIKVSVAERVIQTIKNKIVRYITEYNTERYIDVLEDIVNTYNSTNHRGLMNKTPIEIHLNHDKKLSMKFAQKLYKRHFQSIKPVRNNLSSGDNVRLKTAASSQAKFHKHHFIQNTREIFVIDRVNDDHIPTTYSIKDLEGEKIQGIFYREELIPVTDGKLYNIEIIKKRRKNKKLEYLIKYTDYPNSKPEWISEKQLERIM